MLKQNFVIIYGVLLLAFNNSYAATSANVTFNGRVLSSSCVVDVNGLSNATVNLPDVMTGDFKNTSSVLQKTPFTINLSNCADVGAGALYLTITRPAIGATNLSVPATSGGAKGNVEFSLSDVPGKGPAWVFDGLKATFQPLALVDGKASMTYTIGYQAVKLPVLAGTISTNLKVDIVYK